MKVWHYILIIVLMLFILFLITRDGISSDESYKICVAKCQTDVMNLKQCMEDEQKHWDAEIPDRELRRNCKQLILNEKIDCKVDCAAQEIKIEGPDKERAKIFWDKHVKNFPKTNE